MAARPAIISDKQITMRVERRALAQPRPGMAEARHEYTEVFTTRAKVKTYSGTAEWNTIAVDGKAVTHTVNLPVKANMMVPAANKSTPMNPGQGGHHHGMAH